MRESVQHTRLFQRWFKGTEHYRGIAYEQLFSDDRLRKRVHTALTDLLGRDVDEDLKVPLGKTTPSLRDLVANREELREFFHDTEFAAQVEQALE